jgi:hypothetical protein
MTRPFKIARLRESTVAEILDIWKAIDFKPTYQRQSDLWGETKRQLFVDSLINGYDIPKLYFHDLSWSETGPNKRYAIIDGKQRLEAIRAFAKGEFALSDEFEDIELSGLESSGNAADLGYAELSKKHAGLKARFDRAELPVILVQTDDHEFIEEMFSRLNEAVPLNAPEKRNALGGPLPRQIRRLAKEDFFLLRLAFPNARYRHLDLATKFLYIEYKAGLADLKKRDLDNFVKTFKKQNLVKKSAALYSRAALILEQMSDVFVESDPLLESVGMITIYYQLFRDAFDHSWIDKIDRTALVKFDDQRAQNRARVKEAQELALEGKKLPKAAEINPVMTAFERFVQSPNDFTALTQRYKVLRHFVREGKVPTTE